MTSPPFSGQRIVAAHASESPMRMQIIPAIIDDQTRSHTARYQTRSRGTTSYQTVADRAPPPDNRVLELYTDAEVMKWVERPRTKPVILLFSSKSCRMCRTFLTQLKSLAHKHPETSFVYVNHSHATAGAFDTL